MLLEPYQPSCPSVVWSLIEGSVCHKETQSLLKSDIYGFIQGGIVYSTLGLLDDGLRLCDN